MERKYEDTHQYDDIINLPHHVSRTHPAMSMADRAAQFSPFAALTGHKDAIKETARLTDDWMDMDESSLAVLDRKLALLMENQAAHPEVTITYFEPDERKNGGAYRSVSGTVKRIDVCGHRILLDDGTQLPMEYMIDMDGELFEKL